MALTVIVRSGELKTEASITFDAPRIVVGRGDGCEVLLPDPSVSHRHASIRQRGTDYVLIDEGSTNGTFIGPVRLSPQAPRVVKTGDLIRVGRVWLELRVEQVPVTQSQKVVTREIALALVASALSAQGEAKGIRLKVQKGPAAGTELLIENPERAHVLGRGAGVDLPLDDPDLSRRQLELFRRGIPLMVRDLGSKNGSFIDGQRLESGKDVIWPLEKVLAVGQSELVYEDPVRALLQEIEQGEDERMRPDDEVAPPTNVPHVEPPQSEGPPVALSAGGGAPIAEVPRREAAPRRRGSSRVFELLVGLVALAVLGLSLFGLWLLFRS
ncbi:MAG TPA: FHA domain-containing protein [Polyangiaceae bacterium]|nr:FHA domain-containing protein [Polyangiaceae bacterium]